MAGPDNQDSPQAQAEVLLAVVRHLGRRHACADLEQRLLRWIGRELLADRWARLDRAGRSDTEKIRLARVFVDAAREGEVGNGFVADRLAARAAHLVVTSGHRTNFWTRDATEHLGLSHHGRTSLDWPLNEQGDSDRGTTRWPLPFEESTSLSPELLSKLAHWWTTISEAVVLIGGPGQGKSTATQMLCQIHRAWWITARTEQAEAHTAEVARELLADVSAAGLRSPSTLLLPLRIDLASFAARTRAGEHSLEAYISDRLELPPATSGALVRALCTALPLLVVLDGLDEVPAAAGRGHALTIVNCFLRGAFGQFVVTTRPQGYRGEYGELPQHRIAPWSADTARAYANKLLRERYGDASDERLRVERRIDEALREQGTSRLMQTPLQVTMMAALVARIGRAPRDRWRLFYEYYRLVLHRETEKAGPVGELLAKYPRHVLEIHQHVALLLQSLGELKGGTSTLDRPTLRALVAARMERAGLREERRDELTDRLVDAAVERLVFLAQPQTDGFGFEVRSLQEFFAAGALTSEEDLIVDRLAVIARPPYWRNTLVFAVGHVMEDLSERLQEAVTVGLCERVDAADSEPLDGVAGPGASLALDLLQDGAVLGSPGLARRVLDHALRSLALPPHEEHDRLAVVCAEHDVEEATDARDALMSRIFGQGAPTLTGWRVLLGLAELRPDVWVVVVANWPVAREQQTEILNAVMYRPSPHPTLAKWVLSTLEHFSPKQIQASRGLERLFAAEGGTTGARVLALCGRPAIDEGLDPAVRKGERGQPIEFVPLPDEREGLLPEELMARLGAKETWHAVVAMEAFLRSPSCETLAAVLVAEANAWESGARMGPDWGPWIVHGCLRLAEDPVVLRAMAERARVGAMGTAPDWRAAEQRWKSQGIREDDIAAWVDGAPFGRDLASRGAPGTWSYPALGYGHVTHGTAVANFKALLHAALRLPPGSLRTEVARHTREAVRRFRIEESDIDLDLSPVQAEPLLVTPLGTVDFAVLALISGARETHADWRAWMDHLADSRRFQNVGNVPQSFFPRFLEWLTRRWSDPSTRSTVEAFGALPEVRVVPNAAALAREAELAPPDSFDHPHLASLMWTRRYRSGLDVADVLVSWWQAIASRGTDVLPLPMSPWAPTRVQAEVLRRLWQLAPLDVGFRRSLLASIRDGQRSRESRLARNGHWERLRLPRPGPTDLAHPEPAVADTEPDAFAISRIDVTGLRGLRALSIALDAPADGDGETLVLLGENGFGKTTLLRGVALALVDASVATGFVSNSSAAPFVRVGADAATIVVSTADDRPYKGAITVSGLVEKFESLDAPDGLRPFVVGYGCRRGSALGSARPADSSVADDIDNLFDRPLGLTNAEAWLAQRKAASSAPGDDASKIYDSILRAVVSVLPGVASLEIRNDGRVWATFVDAKLGVVRFDALSDGYLTTAGWVIDMMARWVERQVRLRRPVPPDFCEKMTGYALVDEVDLHLHPAWQTRVLADLRRIFKRMHFIVTTHNPLTLTGARAGEVRVLVREAETGDIRAEKPPVDPRLRTGSELYKYFFGIHGFYPAELHRKLVRYQELAVDPGRSAQDDEEVQRLRGELKDAEVDPGLEPEPREGAA